MSNDHVNWAVLGDNAYRVSNPFSVLSSLGTPIIVSQAGHGLKNQYGGAFSTLPQAGSPEAEGTLNGNFAPGDIILDALDGGTVSLTFPHGVYGGGAQIALPPPSGAGAFTVQVQAFRRDNTLIASFTRNGTFNANADNSALFLGIADTSPDIYRIAYTGMTSHYALFLNRFDIAAAPAAASISHTHLLWTNTDGRAAIWTINPAGSATSTPAYGPIPGWRAKTIADGPDGKTRLLWIRSDGMCAVWTVNNADGSYTSTPGYGPDIDPGDGPFTVITSSTPWSATALAVGPDNLTRLEWKRDSDGMSSIWTLDGADNATSTPGYGPYGSWTASALAVGADSFSRLLWGDSSGQFSVWTLDGSGGITSTPAFGPSGFTATAIAGGPDADARLLVNRSDGAMAVWTVDVPGTVTSTPLYGPISDWTCHALAVGPDALSRVLWTRSDGMSSVWTINGDGSIASTPLYGPISGWSAVALSAGP